MMMRPSAERRGLAKPPQNSIAEMRIVGCNAYCAYVITSVTLSVLGDRLHRCVATIHEGHGQQAKGKGNTCQSGIRNRGCRCLQYRYVHWDASSRGKGLLKEP